MEKRRPQKETLVTSRVLRPSDEPALLLIADCRGIPGESERQQSSSDEIRNPAETMTTPSEPPSRPEKEKKEFSSVLNCPD